MKAKFCRSSVNWWHERPDGSSPTWLNEANWSIRRLKKLLQKNVLFIWALIQPPAPDGSLATKTVPTEEFLSPSCQLIAGQSFHQIFNLKFQRSPWRSSTLLLHHTALNGVFRLRHGNYQNSQREMVNGLLKTRKEDCMRMSREGGREGWRERLNKTETALISASLSFNFHTFDYFFNSRFGNI